MQCPECLSVLCDCTLWASASTNNYGIGLASERIYADQEEWGDEGSFVGVGNIY